MLYYQFGGRGIRNREGPRQECTRAIPCGLPHPRAGRREDRPRGRRPDALRERARGGTKTAQVVNAQYTPIRFTETLALQGFSASIGTVGDAYDNAAAETVIGLYKPEAVANASPFRTGPLRIQPDVETLTTEYVHWYDHHRLHSELGYPSPEEHEQTY
jgi:transposase InsO family protein